MTSEDFQKGDKLKLINQRGWLTIKKGRIYRVESVYETGLLLDNGTRVSISHFRDFRRVARSSWHPHHDVIVAWARGARIEFRDGEIWRETLCPGWLNWVHYRVKPEPDNTAEVAEIEQEMRKLSEAQKELADRLEKLK